MRTCYLQEKPRQTAVAKCNWIVPCRRATVDLGPVIASGAFTAGEIDVEGANHGNGTGPFIFITGTVTATRTETSSKVRSAPNRCQRSPGRTLSAGVDDRRTSSLLPSLDQPGAERRGESLVEFGEEVSVAVESDPDGRMAHSGLDRLGVRSLGDGQGDTRMPEVVKSAGQAGPAQRWGEVVVPPTGGDQRVPRPVGEDQPVDPGWRRPQGGRRGAPR